MTGFRLAKGGAQEIYGVNPDITTLGKVIGGGLPVGAYGGKSQIMESLAPLGPVYQAGTLSGNPLAMQAGLSVLKKLNNRVFGQLDAISREITDGIRTNIKEIGVKAVVTRLGSMMTLFFTDKDEINNYEDAMSCDTDKYANYFKLMLDMGIYLPPSQFECCFFSSVMTKADIKKIINSNRVALQKIA
jgi:glutamate-1-semialdehyde 2,1-aminomutase